MQTAADAYQQRKEPQPEQESSGWTKGQGQQERQEVMGRLSVWVFGCCYNVIRIPASHK